MKISNFKTENFKSCPDGEHVIGKVNVLLGANGKGKTSMLGALRYLLNGKLPPEAVRYGEDHLLVSACIDDGQDTKIERCSYIPGCFRINGEEKKEKDFIAQVRKHREYCQMNGLEAKVGINSNPFFKRVSQIELWEFMETGKTLPGTKVFGVKELTLELPDGTTLYTVKSKPSNVRIDGKTCTAKALNELLKDRIGGDTKALDIVSSSEVLAGMQMPDFAKYLMGIIPVAMDFEKLASLASLTAEEKAALKPLFPESPNPVVPSDVEGAYKMVCQIRQSLSSRMEMLKAKSQYEGVLPKVSSEEVETRLAALSAQKAAADQVKAAWEVYKKRVEERDAAVATLNAWIHEFNELGPVDSKGEEKLRGLLAQEEQVRQQIMAEERSIAGFQQAAAPLRKMLQNLSGTVCPLCDRIVCQTDKSSAKAYLEESIRDCEKNASQARQRVTELEASLASLRKAEEDARSVASLYDRKALLYNKINALKQTIPSVPEQPAQPVDTESLAVELATYQEYQKQYLLYKECLSFQAEYKQVSDQHALYSGLARKAEPKKGLLTNTILQYLLQPFSEHLNRFVKSIYNDMKIFFRMGEGGLQVYCKPHNRNCMLPLNALSTGEYYLALLALMDMVSNISNTRILVFDNLEAVDSTTLNFLLGLLSGPEMAERYDHIFLSMVEHASIAEVVERYPVNIIHF